jgi:hypothetical protein
MIVRSMCGNPTDGTPIPPDSSRSGRLPLDVNAGPPVDLALYAQE